MKMYGIGTSDPSRGGKDRSKNIFFWARNGKTYRSFYTFCTKGHQSFNFFELTLRFNNILQLIHPLTNTPAGLEFLTEF
jgi:hypothetical protein